MKGGPAQPVTAYLSRLKRRFGPASTWACFNGPRMLLSEWIGSNPSDGRPSMLPLDRWDAPVWRWGILIRLFVGEGPELGRHQVARLGHP
jgi:hypothetical protein